MQRQVSMAFVLWQDTAYFAVEHTRLLRQGVIAMLQRSMRMAFHGLREMSCVMRKQKGLIQGAMGALVMRALTRGFRQWELAVAAARETNGRLRRTGS